MPTQGEGAMLWTIMKRKINFVKRKYGHKVPKAVEYIKWIVLLCSIFAIIIIQLTEWRPFGSSNRHEAINEILLNLSYSYLAAMLFHIVMVYIPGLQRKIIFRRQIECAFAEIRICIGQCVSGVYMYDLRTISQSSVSRRRFVKEFCEKNLTSPCDYLDLLNKNVIKISSQIGFLITLKEYLTDKELNILLKTKASVLLTEPLRPTDYIVDEHGVKHELPNSNQARMGKSIHEIYKLYKQLK